MYSRFMQRDKFVFVVDFFLSAVSDIPASSLPHGGCTSCCPCESSVLPAQRLSPCLALGTRPVRNAAGWETSQHRLTALLPISFVAAIGQAGMVATTFEKDLNHGSR